jgi:7,8-dihydropterin-6-yl-methyl-4-(beta-D-ribofuranosyl)aminobenzene 5'-phosphate synthase
MPRMQPEKKTPMPIGHVDITLLVDNQASPGLVTEHGLAIWIETHHHRILFDTGQGPALAANADKLGFPMEQTRTLVLSHGHYDHSGGIPHVFQRNPAMEIFCHPGVVQPRYSIRNGPARAIHMPPESMAVMDKLPSPQIHWLSKPYRLSEDIGLTGPIPRESALEDTGGPFFLDPQGRREDPIQDDSALWINTAQGLVVLVGCSHAGLINTLRHAQRQSGVSVIRAVIGGFHLLQADTARIEWTVAELKAIAPGMIVPCHCTGEKAAGALGEAFGRSVQPGYAGLRLTF